MSKQRVLLQELFGSVFMIGNGGVVQLLDKQGYLQSLIASPLRGIAAPKVPETRSLVNALWSFEQM